jgi:hypothetical protein
MRRKTALLLAAALAVAGCDKKKETKAADPSSAAGDAGSTIPHWSELLGLTGSKKRLKAFSNLDKCLEEMERTLPPELGVVLPNYYNVPDAICRMRQALAEDNVSLCHKTQTYSLRKGCETAFAIHKKRPEMCPLGYPRRRGRDARCLALALRDPTLCLGARYEDEEASCLAILKGDPGPCDDLRTTSRRKRCLAELQRWKGLVTGSRLTAAFKGSAPTMEISIKTNTGANLLPVQTVDVSCAGAGAVVPSFGRGEHVNLCEHYNYRYRYRHNQPGRGRYGHRVRMDFSFRPPATVNEAIAFGPDARLQMRITSAGTYESISGGELRLTRFERKRGGRLSGTFKATLIGTTGRLTAEAEQITVEGKFDTFVRDLVQPSQMRSGRRYGLGYGYGSRYGSGYGSGYGSRGILGSLGRRPSGKPGKPPDLTNPFAPRPAEQTRRFAALLTAATINEVKVGRRRGLQLSGIVRDSLWEHLGLQDGDTVYAVESVRLERRRDVVRIRAELRTRDRVTVKLRRGKKDKSLVLTRPAIRRIRAEFTL